jgi:hypothetical protein
MLLTISVISPIKAQLELFYICSVCRYVDARLSALWIVVTPLRCTALPFDVWLGGSIKLSLTYPAIWAVHYLPKCKFDTNQ